MGLFEHVLERHAQERHAGIFARLRRSRTDPDDVDPYEGFRPPDEAARVMNVTVAELADMVQGGLLEAREVGREVYVRPAVARLIGVKT